MNSARLARIPARMKEFVAAGKTAGVVTLVARHGHVASLEAVGYQDLESKTPMRTDTIFRLASVTKPVTCAGIMILVDEGRLSLIDPVEKYLPEFKGLKLNPCGTRAGYNCAPVTPSRPVNILDLMTHTSGLPGAAPGREAPPNTLAENVAAAFPAQHCCSNRGPHGTTAISGSPRSAASSRWWPGSHTTDSWPRESSSRSK